MAELGQTTDPKALISGDIAAIRGRVDSWRSIGRELAAVSEALGSLTAADLWSGPAASAFEEKAREWTPGWDKAANAYLTAASHLDRYAAELDYAQGRAAEAIDLYERGAAETAAARTAAAEAARNANRAVSGSPIPVGPSVIQPTFFDPGAVTRANAVSMLRTARADLAAAGDDAARGLDGGVDWGRIFQFAVAVQAEFALEALRNAGNAVASIGQALLDHPDLLIEILAGAWMIQAGVAGEAGGVALDATGVGAVAGVPVNVASAGLIVAGVGVMGAGVVQAVGHAANGSRVEPFKTHQNRGPDGKYTGADTQAKAKEQKTLDAIEKELGRPVERTQVRAHVDGGRDGGRYYDGLVRNEDGTYTAVEVKSGTSPYRGTEQQKFDGLVSPDNPATAKLNGETIRITKIEVRHVP